MKKQEVLRATRSKPSSNAKERKDSKSKLLAKAAIHSHNMTLGSLLQLCLLHVLALQRLFGYMLLKHQFSYHRWFNHHGTGHLSLAQCNLHLLLVNLISNQMSSSVKLLTCTLVGISRPAEAGKFQAGGRQKAQAPNLPPVGHQQVSQPSQAKAGYFQRGGHEQAQSGNFPPGGHQQASQPSQAEAGSFQSGSKTSEQVLRNYEQAILGVRPVSTSGVATGVHPQAGTEEEPPWKRGKVASPVPK